MVLDIKTINMPPELGLLWGQMCAAMRRMEELTAGMSAEELQFRGRSGEENSAATLLTHLADSCLGIAQHCLGARLPPDLQRGFRSPRDPDGRLPLATCAGASDLLDRLRQAQAFIKQALDTMQDADLDRAIPVWGGHTGTLRWVLWHVAEHSMLHQGQVRVLRRQWRAMGLPQGAQPTSAPSSITSNLTRKTRRSG